MSSSSDFDSVVAMSNSEEHPDAVPPSPVDHNAPTELPLAKPTHQIPATITNADSQSYVETELLDWSVREGNDVPKELANHPRYLVIKRLGAGGMGEVYLAEHRIMKRAVAIKTINPALLRNAASVERFHREIRAAAMLAHPNIVAAYDAEQAGNLHFLAMEYVEGIDLHQMVREKGRLSLLRACHYIRQAAMGLQHAFDRGMVHRDIKPHNLILTTKNQLKILDFGLARVASERGSGDGNNESLTEEGSIMGTADYISPEQAINAKTADTRADIYSLGCTMYHLITGRVPYPKGSNIEKIMRHVEEKPEPLETFRADVPDDLNAVIQKMMAKNVDERFQKPIDVAKALDPIIKRLSSASEEKTEEPVVPPAAPQKPNINPSSSSTLNVKPAPLREKQKSGPAPKVQVEPSPNQIRSQKVLAEPARKAKPKPKGLSLSMIGVGAFLGIAIGVILMGYLMRKSPLASVEFKSDDPVARVLILAEGKVVQTLDTKANARADLPKGSYELRLAEANPGLQVIPEQIKLDAGQKVVITAAKKPDSGLAKSKSESAAKPAENLNSKPPALADKSNSTPPMKLNANAADKTPQPDRTSSQGTSAKYIQTQKHMAIVDAEPRAAGQWLGSVRRNKMIPVRIRAYEVRGNWLMAGIATTRPEKFEYVTNVAIPGEEFLGMSKEATENGQRITFAGAYVRDGQQYFIAQWFKRPIGFESESLQISQTYQDLQAANEETRSSMRIGAQAYLDHGQERYVTIDVKPGIVGNGRGTGHIIEGLKNHAELLRNDRQHAVLQDVSVWPTANGLRIYHVWARMLKSAASEELFFEVPTEELEAKLKAMESAGKVVWMMTPYRKGNQTCFILSFLSGGFKSLNEEFEAVFARKSGLRKDGQPKKKRGK